MWKNCRSHQDIFALWVPKEHSFLLFQHDTSDAQAFYCRKMRKVNANSNFYFYSESASESRYCRPTLKMDWSDGSDSVFRVMIYVQRASDREPDGRNAAQMRNRNDPGDISGAMSTTSAVNDMMPAYLIISLLLVYIACCNNTCIVARAHKLSGLARDHVQLRNITEPCKIIRNCKLDQQSSFAWQSLVVYLLQNINIKYLYFAANLVVSPRLQRWNYL